MHPDLVASAEYRLRLREQEKRLAYLNGLHALQDQLFEIVKQALNYDDGTDEAFRNLHQVDELVREANNAYARWCASQDAKAAWYAELHSIR